MGNHIQSNMVKVEKKLLC